VIHLHTLGDTLIKVGEKNVRPSSPLVFGALLYLAMERGRRVPRAALQELLFPEADERSGAHSLRQLLYRFG
jgi:DNA-binding SARP family transcriptional activator